MQELGRSNLDARGRLGPITLGRSELSSLLLQGRWVHVGSGQVKRDTVTGTVSVSYLKFVRFSQKIGSFMSEPLYTIMGSIPMRNILGTKYVCV